MKITKNGIPYIDINGINCWIAYLMPFSSNDRNYSVIKEYQEKCIQKNIFGMGWINSFISNKNPVYRNESYITALEMYNRYNMLSKEEQSEYDKAAINAYENYLKIRPGDYVIMRLKNSHYYIGKVSTEAYYLENEDDDNRLSWRCRVEKWVEYKTQEEIASEIVGRFSQKLHPTIDIINNPRQKLTVIAAYENGIDLKGNALEEKEKVHNIPKIKINKYNFDSCFHYTELEDLVYVYIKSIHEKEGYRLYPSSCKVNHAKYEYTLFHPDKKPISCQVKNKAKIDATEYEEEQEQYEKIYLYSGLGFDEEIIQKYKNSNIIIISREELSSVLDEYIKFKGLNTFYTQRVENIYGELDLTNFVEATKWSKNFKKRIKQYKNDTLNLYFSNYDIFYSKEFDALIFNSSEENIESNKLCVEYLKNNLKYKD